MYAIRTMANAITLKGFCIVCGVVFLVTVVLLQSKNISYMQEMEEKMERLYSLRYDGTNVHMSKTNDRHEDQSSKIQRHQRAKRDVDDGDDATTISDIHTTQVPPFLDTSSGIGGAVYVRWGRTVCENDGYTELVYKGVAGGSWFDHAGAASNFLCLPLEPVWGRYSDGAQGLAFVYGAEYQDGEDIFLHTNAEKLIEHNVPCAVCRSKIRSSVIMIPARNVCHKGWHLEYHGYLMSGHHANNGATEYVCVDEAPEADPSGFRDENGRLLYRVEAACGSLPCPNYVANRDLSCAVCSK